MDNKNKKLLFCYDGSVKKNNKNDYYGISINNNVFARYEILSNDINVALRIHDSQDELLTSQYLKIDKDKYKIIECPNISSIKGILLNRQKCRKILEKQIIESDIIIVRLPSFIGNLAINIAKKYNKKYFVELVGCPWDSFWNYSIKGKFIAPFMYFKTKTNVRNADFVLYVTKEFLQKRYPTKGENIGCSDVCLKDYDENILEIRKKKIAMMNKKKFVLGTVAAIDVKYKGQEYVIKSIAKLKQEGFDIEYHIIGSGKKKRLTKIAKKYGVLKNIKFIGVLPHNQVFEELNNIDIYIQPSNQEGLSRALIEAMSRGCPCIASNAGGNPELIDKANIFQKKNVDELCDRIKKMIYKENLYEIAKNNFEISKKYSRENLDVVRKNFYEKVMKMLY